MRARLTVIALGATLVMLWTTIADAQIYMRGTGPRRGDTEISLGGSVTAGQSGGTLPATLTGNLGEPSEVELFRSESSLATALGGDVALAVYLSRALAIEVGFHYARPRVSARLTSDLEGAPDLTATATMAQYLFTGSLLYHFDSRGRTIPFIAGGAGHVRDAHDGNTLIETGTEYHGMAGIKMRMGRRARAGLRFQGGISVRDGGFSLKDGRRIAPMAGASFIYLF